MLALSVRSSHAWQPMRLAHQQLHASGVVCTSNYGTGETFSFVTIQATFLQDNKLISMSNTLSNSCAFLVGLFVHLFSTVTGGVQKCSLRPHIVSPHYRLIMSVAFSNSHMICRPCNSLQPLITAFDLLTACYLNSDFSTHFSASMLLSTWLGRVTALTVFI